MAKHDDVVDGLFFGDLHWLGWDDDELTGMVSTKMHEE